MPLNPLNLVSLGSINEDGSKKTLHPADVSGKFTRGRRLVALLLLVTYVALPLIPVNGFPAVFLDVLNRRFHFMGLTLAVQDLWVGFFLVTGLGFSLFYITALFGRVWCGWTCPYTVFLEHIYRRIERLVDGDASVQLVVQTNFIVHNILIARELYPVHAKVGMHDILVARWQGEHLWQGDERPAVHWP